jgi:hypothetical protein
MLCSSLYTYLDVTAKLWRMGEPFCIQITGFPTNITDWEGWKQNGLAEICNFVTIKE